MLILLTQLYWGIGVGIGQKKERQQMSEIMTRQEAAEIVRTFREVMDTPVTEHREILLGALDMAIVELEKEN